MRFSSEEDDELLQEHLYLRHDYIMSFAKRPICHNVVGRTNFCTSIDQFDILRKHKNVEFPKKNFPAITIRFRPPRGITLLVFSTGQTVGCGTPSDDALIFGFQTQRKTFLKDGYKCSLIPVNIENRVYSFKLSTPISISSFEYEDEIASIWAPDVFPGLVYKMYDPPINMLIFESGSIMITGVKREEDLDLALRHMVPILQKHPNLTYNPDRTRKSTQRTIDKQTKARSKKVLQKISSIQGNVPLSQLRKIFEAEFAALNEESENEGPKTSNNEQGKRKASIVETTTKSSKRRKSKKGSSNEDDERVKEGYTGMTTEEVIRREIEREAIRLKKTQEKKQADAIEVIEDMPDLGLTTDEVRPHLTFADKTPTPSSNSNIPKTNALDWSFWAKLK